MTRRRGSVTAAYDAYRPSAVPVVGALARSNSPALVGRRPSSPSRCAGSGARAQSARGWCPARYDCRSPDTDAADGFIGISCLRATWRSNLGGVRVAWLRARAPARALDSAAGNARRCGQMDSVAPAPLFHPRHGPVRDGLCQSAWDAFAYCLVAAAIVLLCWTDWNASPGRLSRSSRPTYLSRPRHARQNVPPQDSMWLAVPRLRSVTVTSVDPL